MVKIAYGCCVGSWDRFNENVRRDDRPMFAISGNESITKAYNKILASVSLHYFDYLVLQHDDLLITDPNAEKKFIEAFQIPNVEVVGIAGGGITCGLAWWNSNPIGHQRVRTHTIDFGQRTGFVENVEGSFYVFSNWAIQNLRFDEDFQGFNGGYDEVTVRLRNYGKLAYVADIDTYHQTDVGFASQAKADAWNAADQLFREKWGHLSA